MPIVLGYWDVCGLAHAICLLLEYTGANYEEKVYHFGDAPDFDKSQWLDVKFSLGLDFPNLPYLIDGDHKITQSNAILCYIARQYNLCGETEEECIRVDMLENHVMDVRLQLSRVCHNPDFEILKIEYLEQLPGQLRLFSVFLGKWTWFAGEKITYVDFLVYDVLDQNRKFDPCCLDDFTNLKDFLDRFESLSSIAAYLASERCQPYPIFPKIACWGNK